AHKIVQLVRSGAKPKQSVLRLDRSNPYLEDLLPPPEIRVRLKLKHPSRKVFDVRIVAVVQTADLAQPLVEVTVARTVLAKIRLHEQKRGPIRIRPCDRDRKAE